MRYGSHELQSTRTDKMQRLGDLANLPFTCPCFTLLSYDSRICITLSLWYFSHAFSSCCLPSCFRFCTCPRLWRKLGLQTFCPSIAEFGKYRGGTSSPAVVLFTSERCWKGGWRLMKAYNNLALLLRDQCETWLQPEASSEMASTVILSHFEHLI